MSAQGSAPLYEGECRGGPMHGHPGVSRFGAGFVLVDRPAQRCWIYDYMPATGQFVVRPGAGGRAHLPLDGNKILDAALSDGWDVRAVSHWSDDDAGG